MFEVKHLYVGEVKENNDPDQEGKIQVSIPTVTSGFKPSHLPWVQPWTMGTGGANSYGTSSIPEKNTKVWVWFTEDVELRNGYYLADAQFRKLHPHKLFGSIKENLNDSLDGVGELKYPDVKFIIYKNGVCQFVCSDNANPFFGIYHPTGSQVIIDKLGKIYAGKGNGQVDQVVSSTRLKSYLVNRVGNLGAPLFPDLTGENIGFDDFYGGINSGEAVPVVAPPVEIEPFQAYSPVFFPDIEGNPPTIPV